MAEEKKDPDLDAIMADLDVILSDIADPNAAPAQAAAPLEPPPKIETPKPAAAPPPPPAPKAEPPAPKPAPAAAPKIEISLPPKPVEAPKPAEPPKPAAPPPPPAPAPAAGGGLKIELPPREGTIPSKPAEPPKPAAKPAGLPPTRPPLEISLPEEKPEAAAPPPPPPPPAPKAEPPKPAPAAVPAPAPPPAAAPKPAPVPAAAPPQAAGGGAGAAGAELGEALPDKTPKDQIRRVAFLRCASAKRECSAFATFLDQTAKTVSKKPLFLRKVLVEDLSPTMDPSILAGRMNEVKAVAAIVVADAASEAKANDLRDGLSAAGLQLYIVSPGEIQKRSVAVDIIVDLMLLSAEA